MQEETALTQESNGKASKGWPTKIFAITLFAEDLPATKSFYQQVFGMDIEFEDEVSAVFNFGNIDQSAERVRRPGAYRPADVAPIDSGVRMQLTIPVDDVDDMCAR